MNSNTKIHSKNFSLQGNDVQVNTQKNNDSILTELKKLVKINEINYYNNLSKRNENSKIN